MPQSRKWQLTINNPAEKGYGHEKIRQALEQFTSMVYWCMADETGSEGTYHTHVYFVLRTPTTHEVVNNRFPSDVAHRETVRGTSQQNRDYIAKDGEKYNKQSDGSYEYKDSSGTIHTGISYALTTFEEWGEMPQEKQGKSKDVERILELIQNGADNQEIVLTVPSAMMNLEKVERTRSMLRDSQFANSWRTLEVTYVFGKTGSGKTRYVMDKYGYTNCYRVTDYKHPFDTYDGQDVIIFEEFRSSLNIADMLNYLDGYPLLLPCRYFNRQACYTKVYLVTNVPLDWQYERTSKESRDAFIRRITSVVEYKNDGLRVVYKSVDEYEASKVFGNGA